MNNFDVVKKLIGEVRPVGETNTDNARFENLKALCVAVHSHNIDQVICGESYSHGAVRHVWTVAAQTTMQCAMDAMHRVNYEESTAKNQLRGINRPGG